MRYFKAIALCVAILYGWNISAQSDTLKPDSKINNVTVFFSGAQVERSVDVTINPGKYLLVLDSLPQEINPQSIQATPNSGLKILAVKHRLQYPLSANKSSEIKALETKIESDNLKVTQIKNEMSALSTEEKILLQNSGLGNKVKSTTVEQLREAGDFYRKRLIEIGKMRIELREKALKINEGIQNVYAELNVILSKKQQVYSQIILTVETSSRVNKNIKVSYYVPTAGWEPLYDFRVQNTTEASVLVYNANVYQSSGEDWKKANIILSSKNPSLSNQKPSLGTWYVDSPKREETKIVNTGNGSSSITGVVTDESNGEPLPFVNVVLKQDGKQISGSSTDFDGRFTIKPIEAGTYTISISSVGYQEKEIDDIRLGYGQEIFQDIKMFSGVDLQEVEIVKYSVPIIDKDNTSSGEVFGRNEISRTTGGISIRGARTDGDFVYIDGVKVRGARNLPKSKISSEPVGLFNAIKTASGSGSKTQSLEYPIDIAYTILSDGKDNLIKIKESNLPVDYVYEAIPKLENDVFLSAQVKDWNKLNLLSGNVSVYFKGTFTGETYIDTKQTEDTLNVSISRERDVLVKREGNKALNDTRFIGSNVKETLVWDITLKNNKTSSITLLVEDQYPLSERSSIEVELLESAGAMVDAKKGKLLWKVELLPNEQKVISYSYSVKYPKGQRLYGY